MWFSGTVLALPKGLGSMSSTTKTKQTNKMITANSSLHSMATHICFLTPGVQYIWDHEIRFLIPLSGAILLFPVICGLLTLVRLRLSFRM